SSYRSTISDVIGGSIARIFLFEQFDTVILSSICQVGPLKAAKNLVAHFEELTCDYPGQKIPRSAVQQVEEDLESAEIRALDSDLTTKPGELIKGTRKKGAPLGASLEVVAVNVPPLTGEPLYNSLKLRLMGSLGGLHAVQSCEIGSGQAVVERTGSQNNDRI